MLKTYGFLRFIMFFILFPFSPSDVFIYASRSKNENFCSKSSEPLKVLRTKNSVLCQYLLECFI